MNETIDTILSRRNIRKFKTTPVPDDLLHIILQAAVYAPSGSSSQLWRFTAITSPTLLCELNEAVKREFLSVSYPPDAYPAKLSAQRNSAKASYHFFYHAPLLIVVSNQQDYCNAMADSAAALENILLAAHSLGLGGCWINQLTWLNGHPAIKTLLQERYEIPLDHCVCGAAAIGFPDGAFPVAAPRREGSIRIFR